MICTACSLPTLQLVPDGSGLMQPMCDECRVNPGASTLHDPKVRAEANAELQVATARAEAALDALRTLVQSWRKVMREGFSTPEMQAALRRAEEMIK